MGLSAAEGWDGLMGEFPRKSDGRRVFTVEFKRGVVQQLLKGEKTLAQVSRELDIQPCGKPISGFASSSGSSARSRWRSRSTGGDIRTLMDKALWARFGETVTTALHAISSSSGGAGRAGAGCLYARFAN